MRLALCNEVVRDLPFTEQCRLAAGLGYEGLELAPFTLGEDPLRLSQRHRAMLREAAADAGVPITGLHWLLVGPPGLSITSLDDAVWRRTLDAMEGLVTLCADLGGSVLVHGSPAQRALDPRDPAASAERGREAFARIAPAAAAAGVRYCIEPLSPEETDFVTRVEDAASIVRDVGNPALRTMVDCRAARIGETVSVPDLIDRWLPGGTIAHVHVNDRNRRAPGQGDDPFAGVLAALLRHGYRGVIGVEPFVYEPDGPTVAARAIGYLRGVLEGLGYGAGAQAAPGAEP